MSAVINHENNSSEHFIFNIMIACIYVESDIDETSSPHIFK